MKVDLTKTDLINLLNGIKPKFLHQRDTLTRVGLMKFQAKNGLLDWSWVNSELETLSEKQLFHLYNEYK